MSCGGNACGAVGLTAFRGTGYITTTASAAACAETEEAAVTFTDQVNVLATGNTVQKALGNDGFFDAGATSLNMIYNNGYARFTATQTNTDRYIGISSNATAATHASATQIPFNLRFSLPAMVSITFMNRVFTKCDWWILVWRSIQIRVDNNIVRYYRNSGAGDVSLYTSCRKHNRIASTRSMFPEYAKQCVCKHRQREGKCFFYRKGGDRQCRNIANVSMGS